MLRPLLDLHLKVISEAISHLSFNLLSSMLE
jgi:hypothetical protein